MYSAQGKSFSEERLTHRLVTSGFASDGARNAFRQGRTLRGGRGAHARKLSAGRLAHGRRRPMAGGDVTTHRARRGSPIARARATPVRIVIASSRNFLRGEHCPQSLRCLRDTVEARHGFPEHFAAKRRQIGSPLYVDFLDDMVRIREAQASDAQGIRGVHLAAFEEEGPVVADWALALLADKSAQPILVLVAESEKGEVVPAEVAGQQACAEALNT